MRYLDGVEGGALIEETPPTRQIFVLEYKTSVATWSTSSVLITLEALVTSTSVDVSA